MSHSADSALPYRWTAALLFIGIIAAAPAAAPAADPSFKAFVNQLEKNYELRRTHIPLMWLVKGIVRVAQPEGVSRLDLAVFEDQDLSRLRADSQFPERLHKLADASWQPFVEAHSVKSGEHCLLYMRQKGKNMEMLVVVIERHEAVVMLTRVNPEHVREIMDHPLSAFHSH